jgi:hypothetical protein
LPALNVVTKNEFNCHKISIDVGLVTKSFWSPILWWSNIFGRQSYNDQKFLVPNRTTIKSFPLPIMWRSNFFSITIHKVIEIFHFGFRSSNWQLIDFHHWFGDIICCCLGIKTNLKISTHFFLWGVWALCCLTLNNHCHISWEGWNLYKCLKF